MTSLTNLRVITTTLLGTALLITLSRTFLRATRRRFWFDDGFALIAATCTLAGLVCFWLSTSMSTSEDRKHITSWIVNGMFISVIWLVRLSLLCSLIRILPNRLRRLPWGFAAFFVVMWTIILAVTLKLCRGSADWEQVMHQCTARVSLFTTLSFEFFSALILTIFPVVMFKALRSTSTLRRVMAACMGVIGSLLLGGSIARAIYFIPGKNPSLEQLTTIIQVGTGLIVINIPALVLLSAGEEGGILDSPQKTAVDEGSKGLPTSRPVIGIPRPLSSKSSFMTSQTPSDKPETPDVPYHFSFFPPFSNEERREKALLFGLHVDSWYKVPKSPTSSSDDHLKPPHDSLTSSASMYSTDPAAAQFMTQGRNVRFKSSPSIIPQTKSISDSEAESTVRDSGFSDTSIARPPPVAGCYSPRPVKRPRSWMSISLDASEHSTQAASSSSSRLRVESPVPITPARICSLEPPPISTAPSAWHSLAPGPGDTPSQVGSELPSWMSGFDSLTYSSFVHRYFVDKDPFGQDLAEPPRPSTFFEGPEAPERASVAPRPF